MYLIDGNNVMGQRVGWHRDRAAARRQLLDDLARLAQAKKARLAVVFDGAPEANFPDGSSYRGVKVFYARPGSDADRRIIEIVERERDRRGLLVVTSDRELGARVRACGVRVMRAGQFRRALEEAAGSAQLSAEPTVSDDEVAEWLRYFGVADEAEGEERF
jgi:predicted RNA-binding protein with PIN domain